MAKSRKLKPYLTALTFVASVFWANAGSAQDAGILTGVIKDAAGAPVAGAFVQMKNAERRLNFMVIRHEEGRYTNNRLPAGKYVVQAIGGEQQSAPSAPVEVVAGKPSSVDLALTVARAPALPPAWARPPGDRGEEDDAAAAAAGPRLPDGDGKAIIQAKCTVCHDAQRIVRSHGEPARWQQVIGTMKLYAQGSTLAQPLTDDEEKVLLAYVSTNFGPLPGGPKPKPDPFSRLPRTLLPPEARNYIVVEYELPNTRAEPHEVAVDPSGNGWVTQRVGGKLGRLDAATLSYIEYAPPAAASTTVRLNAIRRGNREFWMVDGGPSRRWLTSTRRPSSSTIIFRHDERSASGAIKGASGQHRMTRLDRRQPGHPLDPATKQFAFFGRAGRRQEQDAPFIMAARRRDLGGGNAVNGSRASTPRPASSRSSAR